VSSQHLIENGGVCNTLIPHDIIPWSAGCFYKQAGSSNNENKQAEIDFEKKMLDRFNEKNGVNTEILWYRLEFHIKHQNHYQLSFQDLHQMYSDYTRSQHIKLDRQVAYLGFLLKADLTPLAQSTLNDFCDTYLIRERRREAVSKEFEWRLKQQKLPLNLEHCRNVLPTR
jgi:hypothetical protein